MFDRLFLKLERQDQGRGPNQKCVKITFNLPLVNAPINALHLRKWYTYGDVTVWQSTVSLQNGI